MAEFQIAMRLGTPQIEIAVTQPRLLARGHLFFDLEGRRLRVVQYMQARGYHFHLAGSNFRIGLLASQNTAFDSNDKFRAKLLCLRVRLRMQLFVEHNLRESGSVAQVDENQLA